MIHTITHHTATLFAPYSAGFITPRHNLDRRQRAHIVELLRRETPGDTVQEFEQRLAALIGTGDAVVFAAGRMAFYALLTCLGVGPGDEVVLPGFTCSVMTHAVQRVGATPVYADIARDTMGSAPEAIERRLSQRTRLVVAQHSFGIPCDISAIRAMVRPKNIFLVEDCALALDSRVGGTTVGNIGDAAIFSTNNTKPLNTIIGGAVYSADGALIAKIRDAFGDTPQLHPQHQHRLYYRFCFENRWFTARHYPRGRLIRIGDAVARRVFGGRRPVFLESEFHSFGCGHRLPVYPFPARLPAFLAQLGIYELERWPETREDRRRLLTAYLSIARRSPIRDFLPSAYHDPNKDITPFRFAYTHPNAAAHRNQMASRVDVGYTWFTQPVVNTPDGLDAMGYHTGDCPTSESVCRSIINWPTSVPENLRQRFLRFYEGVINTGPNSTGRLQGALSAKVRTPQGGGLPQP